MDINNRIKHLRKNILKVTQQDLADALNISRANMGNIEVGRVNVTERMLKDISEKFNVTENWLRTGEGEIFVPTSRSDSIARFAGELMKDEDESFRRRLVEALASLDLEEWEVLEKLAGKLMKKD